MPANEEARQQVVAASGALDARSDAVLQSLVEEATASLGTGMAAISIVYKEWQYLIAAVGMAPGVYSRRTSLCGHAIAASEQIFCIGDMQADDRFAGNPVVTDDQQLRFYAGAVLTDGEGVPLGTLCVFDQQARAVLDAAERARLHALAARVMARLSELRSA